MSAVLEKRSLPLSFDERAVGAKVSACRVELVAATEVMLF
jgi:hypothetical protein